MAYSSTALSMLISAPSDIPEGDLATISRTIMQWNASYGRTFGLTVTPISWTENAVSEFGERPQAIINSQLVDTSDIALAIFNRRLGTPTGTEESGTAEEIMRMVAAGKPVSILRCMSHQAPISGSSAIEEQLRLERFLANRIFQQGLVLQYRTSAELVQHVNNVLRVHSSKFHLSARASKDSSGEIDLASGVWPRIETTEVVVTDNRGQLKKRREIELVLENTVGRPVHNVCYRFITSGAPFDLGPAPEPVTTMAPGGSLRYPILASLQSAEQAECEVTWEDAAGRHKSVATVRR